MHYMIRKPNENEIWVYHTQLQFSYFINETIYKERVNNGIYAVIPVMIGSLDAVSAFIKQRKLMNNHEVIVVKM